jgi:signal peptidase I
MSDERSGLLTVRLPASRVPRLLAVPGLVGLLLLTAVLRLRTRFVVVTVSGESMRPTHSPGDRLLVRRRGGDAVRRGQVVVFAEDPVVGPQGPCTWLVKRVAAVAGDPVPRDRVPVLRSGAEAVVPPGRVVVLGDNAARSFDSRHFGYVPAERIVGVAVRQLGGRSRGPGDHDADRGGAASPTGRARRAAEERSAGLTSAANRSDA